MLTKYLRAILAAFKMNFLSLVVDGFFIFASLIMPIIYALIAFGILRDKGAHYGIFVAVGSGITPGCGVWVYEVLPTAICGRSKPAVRPFERRVPR